MTTRGKVVLTILLLGIVGFGVARWWDKMLPDIERNEYGGAGNIIRFADILIFRPHRIVEAPVIPCRGVVPEQTSRLLLAAVGVNEMRPDQAGVRRGFGEIDQPVERARREDGVVVEKIEIFARSLRRRRIAGAQKAEVFGIFDQFDSRNAPEFLDPPVLRQIFHHQDFDGAARRMFGDRGQAIQSMIDLAIAGQNDRNLGATGRSGKSDRFRKDFSELRGPDRRRRPEFPLFLDPQRRSDLVLEDFQDRNFNAQLVGPLQRQTDQCSSKPVTVQQPAPWRLINSFEGARQRRAEQALPEARAFPWETNAFRHPLGFQALRSGASPVVSQSSASAQVI